MLVVIAVMYSGVVTFLSAIFVLHSFPRFLFVGSNPDRPIRILYVGATPMPVRSPGKLRLSFQINVTHALPETVAMDISIVKYFYKLPFKIPCYNNFGTW